MTAADAREISEGALVWCRAHYGPDFTRFLVEESGRVKVEQEKNEELK